MLVRHFCETCPKQDFEDLAKFPLTEAVHASSIGQRIVGFIHWWTLPWAAFDPPQGPLVGPWGVFPGHFDYESTLLLVRHPSTKIHQFPTPKT